MRRRHGILALAALALLLLTLGWQDEPGSATAVAAQAGTPPTASPPQPVQPGVAAHDASATAATGATKAPQSWRAMPEGMSQQLAGDIADSDQPLAERLVNLAGVESQWLSEGESLTLLQGRYAEALAQLASDGEQLSLAERLAALTRLQDEWAAQYPDLAADLFNPDARLQQARQLWGDEELETLARHFLPAGRAEASLAFAGARQQQLDQRSRYQLQLAELEQQLAVSQGAMDDARWQQHREQVLGQFRRDFFSQEQGRPRTD